MEANLAHPYNRRRVLTIDDLPDDDLLAIFDFYVVRYQDLGLLQFGEYRKHIESWQSLVHVCRRWRGLVFESPRRLNLQLYYEPKKVARKSLDVWPALPLLIEGSISETSVDDAIAGLKHNDRICQISLICHTTWRIKKFWAAMQVPFPELTRLSLSFGYSSVGPALPDLLLGRSAPRLRYLSLRSIPFPGLPKLLLSATHLVHLNLHDIPLSGYISPNAMATCLSVLTSLETLRLEVESSQSSPGQENRRSRLPSRFVLPTLANFSFAGLNEYLEEFVARIDAPQLYRLSTTFFNNIDFNTPELSQFISRASKLGAYDRAHLNFSFNRVRVELRQFQPERSDHRMVEVETLSSGQHSTLVKICNLSLRLLLTMENLYIDTSETSLVWQYRNAGCLDLLLLFTAVKNLYLSKPISPRIAFTLQELTGGRTTEVLPALQNIFLEGFRPSEPFHEGIALFISARQLTDHPVAISAWERETPCGTTWSRRRWMIDSSPSSASFL